MNRHIIKKTLFTLVSIIFLLSAVGKFAGREAIVTLFTDAGMTDYLIRFAVIQLIIVACLWYKPLRSLGVLVASAFLGGVIVMMINTECSPLSAGLTLIMLWVAYKLEWWGYWNHYTDTCSCGWCKLHSKGKGKKGICPNPKDKCDCGNHCDCPKGKCTCS